jgi:N-acetylmuramoyl-L-alanine amidase
MTKLIRGGHLRACVISLAMLGASCVASACSSSGGSPRANTPPTSHRSDPTTSQPSSSATSPTASTTTSFLLPGRPLAGKVVGIDPGHNGMNYTDPTFLSQQVFNGRTQEDCDTTGTETASGYTEAQFNFNVAQYLTADLQTEGAQVVLTRTTNSGIGPCVDQRAQILNAAHANVAIDIHADGGPTSGRGFAVLEPVADGPNDGVIAPSEDFGNDVISSFTSTTGMPISTYDGVNGIAYRDDLAGLNLTTVPKILIECGNMQNATDAAMLESSTWQQTAAQALAAAITTFLTS